MSNESYIPLKRGYLVTRYVEDLVKEFGPEKGNRILNAIEADRSARIDEIIRGQRASVGQQCTMSEQEQGRGRDEGDRDR